MKTYMVGGAVRDMIMGFPPMDVDYVVVGSTPEEMIADGYKQVGADFPVFLDEFGTEYALARTERKTGTGYNGFTTDHSPEVTLEDDLSRRDLTINAMAMDTQDRNLPVIDPFGGLLDIERKVLRHVSPAFAEDPVRVLRIARFLARFGPDWHIDATTLALMTEMVKSGELDHLTRERVLKEFEKALSEPFPDLFFRALDQCGALKVVLPEVDLELNMMRNFSHASPKLNYAVAAGSMKDRKSFEHRLNVSNEWRSYADMFTTITESVFWNPVERLYECGAYRNSRLFLEVTRDMGATEKDAILKAYNLTRDVGFDDLSTYQQETLRGPEIAAAIKQLRKDLYESRSRNPSTSSVLR